MDHSVVDSVDFDLFTENATLSTTSNNDVLMVERHFVRTTLDFFSLSH